MQDQLKKCGHCGSDYCYEQTLAEGVNHEFCFSCGFIHSSLHENEEYMKEQLSILPELYKDLIEKDEQGNIWIPTFIRVEGKGVIFANGPSKDMWGWSAAKMKSIPKEEQKMYPIPGSKNKYNKEKIDMETIQHFQKNEISVAMDYLELV